jgi:hypothetical protein
MQHHATIIIKSCQNNVTSAIIQPTDTATTLPSVSKKAHSDEYLRVDAIIATTTTVPRAIGV